MKSIKYILIPIIALFLFNSCEYEIDYKGDLPKDKLVVSSFIEADSVISFSLFTSAKPGTFMQNDFDSPFKSNKSQSYSSVSNAKAELYINGNLKQTLNGGTDLNEYKFSVIPQANEKVEIRISYKDYEEAVGFAELNLQKPAVDSANILVQQSITDSLYIEPIYRVVVYLEIRDNGGDNYYQIDPNIYYENMFENLKLSLTDSELLWESIAGVYQEASANFQSSSNRFGVISNKLFKGKTYKVKIAIPIQSRQMEFNTKAKGKIKGSLNLSAIDKKSYNYLFTLNRYYNAAFMNEPVIIIDGVENAYGFIGAKNTLKAHVINFDFDDYEK